MTKKITLPIVAIVVLIGIGLFVYFNQTGEKATNNEAQNNTKNTVKKDVREAVWDQLPPASQQSIKGTWQDGKVSKITLTKDSMIVVDNKMTTGYTGEAYMIDWTTKNMGVPNNMIVYADLDTFDLIGYGLVD